MIATIVIVLALAALLCLWGIERLVRASRSPQYYRTRSIKETLLAELAQSQLRLRLAGRRYRRATSAARLSNDAELLMNALFDWGQNLFQRKCFRRAYWRLDEANRLAHEHCPPGDQKGRAILKHWHQARWQVKARAAMLSLTRARLNAQSGYLSQAEHFFEEALRQVRDKEGENSLLYASALNQFAEFKISRGQMVGARQLLKRARLIIMEWEDPHEELAESISSNLLRGNSAADDIA